MVDLHDIIYNYVFYRTKTEELFLDSVTKLYYRNSIIHNNIINYYLKLLSKKTGCYKYVFIGTRFSDIILGLPREHVLIIGGIKQALFCTKHSLSFCSNGSLWKMLLKYFNKDVASFTDRFLEQSKIFGLFKSEYLIVENDSLPMQRFFIKMFEMYGVKSICVQHGLFQSKAEKNISDGWMSDL